MVNKNKTVLNNPTKPKNRRIKRREEYARVQDLWKKDPGRCTQRIIKQQLNQTNIIPKDVMVPYWVNTMTPICNNKPNINSSSNVNYFFWNPITIEEIKYGYPSSKTASGPDGLSVKQLKRIPGKVLVRIITRNSCWIHYINDTKNS